jgi:hypothetical protein
MFLEIRLNELKKPVNLMQVSNPKKETMESGDL